MNGAVRARIAPAARAAERVVDYASLMKPELTGLSVVTALFGAFLAQGGIVDLRAYMVVFAGTLLVGCGAGMLNQFIERREDALMKRTERRPLPGRRVTPGEALAAGVLLSAVGVALLYVAGNLLSGTIALVTSVSYLFLYTPLKKLTPAATPVGGIPGALPPVIGWTVVRDSVGVEATILFLILFAWQMPHFYSLAWLYRKDYARAGYAVLTVRDESGGRTAARTVAYSALLVPLGAALYAAGLTGMAPAVLAAALGGGMLYLSLRFRREGLAGVGDDRLAAVNRSARRLFFASLLYLPALIAGIAIGSL